MKYRLDFIPSGNDIRVYIRQCYKDSFGKYRKAIYRKCGTKSELLAKDPQAIDKLQREVDGLNAAIEKQRQEEVKKLQDGTVPPEIAKAYGKSAKLEGGDPVTLSLGMLPLNRIWRDLGLSYLFDYLSKNRYSMHYDLSDMVRQLTLLRVLNPASKQKTCEKLAHRYMTGMDLTTIQAYRCLDVLNECKDDVVRMLNMHLSRLIPQRKTHICLYDITTFAFESTDADTLRDFGYSKDQKFNDVQVVMALGADGDGIPLDYGLFKGNQGEVPTMIPFMDKLSKSYGCKKFTIVADRGLNSNGNIDCAIRLGHDVVVAFKIGSASDDLKKAALSEEGRIPLFEKDSSGKIRQYGWYKEIVREEELKYRYPDFAMEKKSGEDLEEARDELKGRLLEGSKKKYIKSKRTIRFLITYTDKRAKKDRAALKKLLKKAKGLIENPADYEGQIKRGGRCLIKETGVEEKKLELDQELIDKKTQLIGIHVIETTLMGDAKEILDIYRQLWRIEDGFKTMKTQISSRPVFVRTEGHVRGHFLLCYMALVVVRYLEYLLRAAGKTHGLDCIIDSLNEMRIERQSPKQLGTYYTIPAFNEEQRDLFEVTHLGIPSRYEWGPALRALLRLNGKIDDYFPQEDEEASKVNEA